jgi:hypothetical protein
MLTAFLIKKYKSSGREGAKPLACEKSQRQRDKQTNREQQQQQKKILKPRTLRIRVIFLPVTFLTMGIPEPSLNMAPMAEGVFPLRARRHTNSTTSLGFCLTQEGGAFL